jgi:uncharacterized protein
VAKRARQPGKKEARFAHLLCGAPAVESGAGATAEPPIGRVAQLEKELHELRAEFDDLKRRFEALEGQLR